MASKEFTVDNIIKSLKRRSVIPISQQTFTKEDILDYLQDEMESTVVPTIINYREEFFVKFIDILIPQNNAEFEIPRQAVGAALRDVVLVHKQATGDVDFSNLPRLSLEKISTGSYNGSTLGSLYGFWLEDNTLKLYPRSGWGLTDQVRLHYFKRPPHLVFEKFTSKITAINTVNKTVSVNNVPLGFVNGKEVSIIRGYQPFTHVTTSTNLILVNGNTFTLDDVSKLTIGDYICEVDESPIPMIPVEAMNVLIQATKIVMLEAIDDQSNIKLAREKLSQMEKNLLAVLSPRVQGEPRKVVNKNNTFGNYNGRWY